jgi:thiamine biosynthesis lipoprotein
MNNPVPLPDAHRFIHEAMNTTFTFRFRGVDEQTAAGMARECIDQLDHMESKLSRYIDGSDVSRINRMKAGETLYLSETCHQCLLLALDACVRTGGLFDITLGTRIEHRKSGDTGPLPPLAGTLTIHPDVPAVTCGEPGREIDLGGIGKGFALDQLKQFLTEWGAEDFLLAAGASSLLAHGPTEWPVELAGNIESTRIALRDQSLSASGITIQGSHIIHPAGPDAMPAAPCNRLWVTAATAALAEVWSTALMLVPVEEIPDFIAGNEDVTGVYADLAGTVDAIR